MALAGQDTNVKRRDASGPGQAERFPIVSMVLLALTFIGMMISIWMIFLYAPTDAIEGDAHLTTTLILWFIYIGYLMLRSYMGRTPASARAGAVLAIIGLIDVPIIYESVNWWRTLHPQAVLPLGSSPQLPLEMLLTLVVAFITFTLLFSFLMVQLYQLEKMQTLAQQLRASVE